MATPVVVSDEGLSNLSGLRLASRYQLGDVRAHGALCVVYDAQDAVLRRPVTIKVTSMESAAPYQEALAASAGLSYPAFVAVYDVIEQDERVFIAQEYIDGRPLADYLQEGTPCRRSVALALQLARAIAYAHEHDLTHGDLTPAAVLVDRNAVAHVNNVRLPTDWEYFAATATTVAASGLAPSADATLAALRADERLRDVWSVGALLWMLVTQTSDASGEPTPVAARIFRQDVPQEAQRVIERALDVTAERALGSADALALALETLDDSLRQSATSQRMITPLAVRAYRDEHEWDAAREVTPGRRRGVKSSVDELVNAPTIPGGVDPVALDTSQTRPADDALRLATPVQPYRGRLTAQGRDAWGNAFDPRMAVPTDQGLGVNAYAVGALSAGVMRPWVWTLIGVALFVAFFLVGFLIFPQLKLF